ncbi:minichromosome maintenance protein MCM [Candidatus Micrarchaeota archaeon]|nr:minichromosome maintenance protein MCM [Candidatus Micrarchaeota archaeon]
MDKVDLTPLIVSFNDFFTSVYKRKIDDLLLIYPSKKSLYVDYRDLEKFDPELADKLITNPEIIIESAEESIRGMRFTIPGGDEFAPRIRFTNITMGDILIEQLASKNINELVAFKAVVTKRAEVMHRVKIAYYKCEVCDSEMKVPVTKNFIQPKRCDSCKKLALVHMEEQSKYVDVQRGEVQELLERVRGGSPTAKIELLLEDDLVNLVVPGENIELIGIMRLRPPLKIRNKNDLVYTRYIEVNSVVSLKRDFEEIEISKEDEKRILELSKNPNVEKLIVDSIVPGVYGHEEVKRALMLQLFGGTKGKTMQGGATIREDIHLLLIGDPGLAKSRFLQGVTSLAPKSIYVSGKTTTGVGLTISAEKDELGDGGWTLKAGALVLASGGLTAIDEFDKIDEEDRAALHEVMESGSVSVAKAGIVAKFKAKSAIVAAANPKYGRFDQNKNLAEQFDIPPTLLSRFDLIFPIVDVLDPEKDAKLAQHILDSHMGKQIIKDEELVDRELLRKYVAYARRTIYPKLTNQAIQKIKEFYVDLRRMGKDVGSVTITPRYLEGLVRLAEASAKVRLNQIVEDKDAEAAVALLEYVMKKVMTDKVTGMLDIDTVATGKPKSEREKLQKADVIIEIIKEHLKKEDSAEIAKVIADAASYDIDEATAVKIIQELLKKGEIYEKEHGHIRLVGERR